MTLPATTRKAGPFQGDGVDTAFPFSFKVFSTSDVAVKVVDTLGVESTLVLDTDYSVSLNADQDTTPGGTVTYPLSGDPLASDEALVVIGDVDYDQPLRLPTGGNFSPTALMRQLDRQVMQIQQLRELLTRTLTIPASSDATGELPSPEASALLAWNTTADALENIPLSSLTTAIGYGTIRTETFDGDGAATSFMLAEDPVVLGNTTVVVDGLTLTPSEDYVLAAGGIVFAVAPSDGAEIVVRYGQSVASGTPATDSLDVTHLPATGPLTTVRAAIRAIEANEWVTTARFAPTAIAPFAAFANAISPSTTSTTQAIGDNSTKLATTEYADRAAGSPFNLTAAPNGSNGLLITLAAGGWYFRNVAPGTGGYTYVSTASPLTLTISSGSTLGTVSGVQSDILVRVVNDGGTLRLTAENLAGGMDASETGLISTTAEGGAGAADSATVIYSGTAVTSKAYLVAGLVRSTQATAGTWVTNPSLVQGAGGNTGALINGIRQIGYTTSLSGLSEYTFNFNNPNARELELVISDVSETAGVATLVQLGDAGGVETSGYSGSSISMAAGGTAGTANSTGFGVRNSPGAAGIAGGAMKLKKTSGNTWVCSAALNYDNAAVVTGGSKTLSDTATQLKISVSSGTFDAGTVSLFMEQ
jgi:hypothetical protein